MGARLHVADRKLSTAPGLRGETCRAKKETLVYSMKCLKLDILLLQETHVNTNSTEVIAGFTFIYSTSITDEQRKQAENLRTTPRVEHRTWWGRCYPYSTCTSSFA